MPVKSHSYDAGIGCLICAVTHKKFGAINPVKNTRKSCCFSPCR